MSKIWTEGVLPENAKKTSKKNGKDDGKDKSTFKKQKAALKQTFHGVKFTKNPLIFLPAE